jgi:hypothetical protein
MRRVPLVALGLAAALPPLYRWSVGALLRRNLRAMKAGDPGPTFATYAEDVRFVFPGRNSWTTDIRGREELERWVRRFVDTGLQLDPEQVLVSGPPWNTTMCLRYTDRYTAPDGSVPYENQGVIYGKIAWGKLKYYEVCEDTNKVDDFDAYLKAREQA